MDIQVDYTVTHEEFVETVRGNLVGSPARRWFFVVFWLLVAAVGVLTQWVFVVVAVVGLSFNWLAPALHRKVLQGAGQRYSGPTSVRITAEGLGYAAGAVRYEIPWGDVSRVTDSPVGWAVTSRLKTEARVPIGATLVKAKFTPEQRAEFQHFLATDLRLASKVRGPVKSQFV